MSIVFKRLGQKSTIEVGSMGKKFCINMPTNLGATVRVKRKYPFVNFTVLYTRLCYQFQNPTLPCSQVIVFRKLTLTLSSKSLRMSLKILRHLVLELSNSQTWVPTPFFFSHFVVDLLLCLGSLCSCMTQFGPSF